MVAARPITDANPQHARVRLGYRGTSWGDVHHQVSYSLRYSLFVTELRNLLGLRAVKCWEMSNLRWCTSKLGTWWAIGTGIQRCPWSRWLRGTTKWGIGNGVLYGAPVVQSTQYFGTECERVGVVPGSGSCWAECTRLSHIVCGIYLAAIRYGECCVLGLPGVCVWVR